MTLEPTIVIEQLQKSYGAIQAVKGISLRVQQGEIFGFLGPNGAGKTTTIRCMLDVIRPTAGAIRILGWDAQRDTLSMHQHIGYLPGDVRLPGRLTGKQLIDYYTRLQTHRPVLLHDLIARFDVEIKRPLKSYSKGMRQKIGIVLAFMCDPGVLILDEPTSGLDPLVRKIFNVFLLDEQARGKTIFLSSHVLSEVEKVCQRVAIIREGELVAVEAVEVLREKAGQRVIVEFGDMVTPEELEHIPGVSDVTQSNGSYHLHVSGSMNDLVKALSRHDIHRLLVEEAPLEDVFLKFYEGSEDRASVTR